MSDTAPKHSWFRPGGIVLMLLVAGLFIWGNLANRGVSARDSFCLGRSFRYESYQSVVNVKGLPFAFSLERVSGQWFPREFLSWAPVLFDIAACAAGMASIAVAWRVWRAHKGIKARLQFHLSTAVILMFVAGLLLWANILPSSEGGGDYSGGYSTPYRFYGWPLTFWEIDDIGDALNHPFPTPVGYVRPTVAERFRGECFKSKGEAAANLAFDVIACFGIVFFVGLICEAWIVWRAKPGKGSCSA